MADNADTVIAKLLDHRRLEHAAGRGIEGLRIIEGGLLGEKDILRQELTFEFPQIPAQGFFPVGEFPVPGHRLYAEKIGGLDHVLALQRVCETAALPKVAAVEQQRWSGLRAQTIDQSFEMGKSTERPIAMRRRFVVEIREGVGETAVRGDAEVIEKRLPNQMRRLVAHGADADIDARLAIEHRHELRVGVGHVQDARVAEAADIVDRIIGGRATNAGSTERRADQHCQ